MGLHHPATYSHPVRDPFFLTFFLFLVCFRGAAVHNLTNLKKNNNNNNSSRFSPLFTAFHKITLPWKWAFLVCAKSHCWNILLNSLLNIDNIQYEWHSTGFVTKGQLVKSMLVFSWKSFLSLSMFLNAEPIGAPSAQINKCTVDYYIGYNKPATLCLHVVCNKSVPISFLPEDSNVPFCQGCSNNAIVLVLQAQNRTGASSCQALYPLLFGVH